MVYTYDPLYYGVSLATTYTADNRLAQLIDWQQNTTSYEYDEIGRLITATLANGVITVQGYDANGRLLHLRYTAAGETLLAEFSYQLDGVGNRTAVTETLYHAGAVTAIEAILEEIGILVMEAENGVNTAGDSHDWQLPSSLVQAATYIYEQINYCSYGPGQSARNPSEPPQSRPNWGAWFITCS
jgi:YD repeat-containing protein